MWFAAATQAAPFGLVRSDRNRGDLGIGVEISLRQHLAEFLRAEAGVLAGDDIDDVLDRIRRHRGGIVGVGIGAGKVALDHRLDAELTDLMAVAVPVDPHHPNAAFPVSVLDQRHPKASRSARNLRGSRPPAMVRILSNLRATGQGLRRQASGTSLVSVQTGLRACTRGSPNMSSEVHPVDQILPTPRLLALGLQHVLVIYAGAVAVPLIIGRALKLPPEDVAFLISADLFACGIATLVQCIGFPGVGIRLPVMMGVTFASVGPMLSMAAAPDIGLLGIYGSVIAAGLFAVVVAPFVSRLLPLFPPVVTGTIILVIGISLMRVGINWAGGGLPTLTKVVDGVPGAFPNPAYGQLQGLGISLFVLLVILGLLKWGSGFISNVAVLLGIVAGAVLAAALGVMQFQKVGAAPWVALVLPLHFGAPKFQLIPIITMCIVMIVVMIESLGMFLALGDITGKQVSRDALTRGLRADGVGTFLGGVFKPFSFYAFSQNCGV